MQRVPILSVMPGMVLAQSILRSDGMVLAGAGLVLTDEGIAHIRTTGVTAIMIEGEAGGGEEACAEFERVTAMLGHLFRKHKGSAFMMTLHNMLAAHFARRIAACKEAADAALEASREKAAEATEAQKEGQS